MVGSSTPQAKPGLIPRAIGWALARKPVRAFLRYSENRGPMLADSVTYRTLFSLFAGVLLGFSIAGLWLAGNPQAWSSLISAIDNAIPGLVGEGGIVDPDSVAAPAGLTIASVVSSIGLVWAAIGAIGSLRIAMRTIADKVTDDTLFIWVQLRNLGLGLGIGAALVTSAAVTFAGTAFVGGLQDWLGLDTDDTTSTVLTRIIAIVVTFALDLAVVAVLIIVLSGVRAPARALWPGAIIGAVGLTVLQQLSGLFVGGASTNPLLASFASLIALLLWLNLSVQVILYSTSYVVTGVEEKADRVSARFGASTFAQRRVARAEVRVRMAADELAEARRVAEKERETAAEKQSEAPDTPEPRGSERDASAESVEAGATR